MSLWAQTWKRACRQCCQPQWVTLSLCLSAAAARHFTQARQAPRTLILVGCILSNSTRLIIMIIQCRPYQWHSVMLLGNWVIVTVSHCRHIALVRLQVLGSLPKMWYVVHWQSGWIQADQVKNATESANHHLRLTHWGPWSCTSESGWQTSCAHLL